MHNNNHNINAKSMQNQRVFYSQKGVHHQDQKQNGGLPSQVVSTWLLQTRIRWWLFLHTTKEPWPSGTKMRWQGRLSGLVFPASCPKQQKPMTNKPSGSCIIWAGSCCSPLGSALLPSARSGCSGPLWAWPFHTVHGHNSLLCSGCAWHLEHSLTRQSIFRQCTTVTVHILGTVIDLRSCQSPQCPNEQKL